MAKDEWRGRRYVIKRERLDLARRRLRIEQPVEIRITYYRTGDDGGVIGFRDGTWRIGLDTYLTANQASRTLWHELVHVAQARRAGGLDQLFARVKREHRAVRLSGRNPRRFFKSHAYRQMPLEKEAEQRSRLWHERYPLAQRRKA